MAPFLAPEVPVRDPNEDGSRFWICDLDDSVPEHLAAAGTFGDRTVGVVDEVEGGIVLWVHEDNALRVVEAFRAFTGEI